MHAFILCTAITGPQQGCLQPGVSSNSSSTLTYFLYLSAKSLEIIESCFVFTKVSKSIVDKVIKPGRDSRDNMGWVEAQLKGEPQPASGNCLLSIHPSRVSQPWHYCHWALHNPLLHVLCCTLIVGCLAATLHSIHYMPAVLF